MTPFIQGESHFPRKRAVHPYNPQLASKNILCKFWYDKILDKQSKLATGAITFSSCQKLIQTTQDLHTYLRYWQRSWCQTKPNFRSGPCRTPAASHCTKKRCPRWRWSILRTRRPCLSTPWSLRPTWCSACAKRWNDKNFQTLSQRFYGTTRAQSGLPSLISGDLRSVTR